MNFIFQSDIHLRSATPVNRIDDYPAAELDKFGQLLGFAEQYDCDILCGGDLTDKPSLGFEIYNPVQEMLRRFHHRFITVCGQHDLLFHNISTLTNTALYGLYSCKALEIVPTQVDFGNRIIVHGVNWEQQPSDPVLGAFNIFLGHVSVFAGAVPFYFKGEAYTPKTLKEKYPGFDLYLCGDIHIPLVEGNVVVSGPMMRQNIDQIDYQPRCYLIDTDTMEITPLYYKINKDVFNISDVKDKPELELDSLIEAMGEATIGRESYQRDCMVLAEKPEVKNFIVEVFNELD